MTLGLAPPYDDLTFMTPLSEARARRLVRFLAGNDSGTMLDIGCGWGELLLRTVAAAPGTRGVGVDLDEDALAHGRRLAASRGLADRVTFVAGDGRTAGPAQADAVICIGASQVWGAPVQENAPLDYATALTAIRDRTPRGGRVVYGEGIWSREPTPEAAASLGGRLDEFICLAELVDIAVATGFMPVSVQEASLDEWDEFESGYSACYATWLAEPGPDRLDTERVRDSAQAQRERYLRGYRGVLGLAYLGLRAV